MSWTEDRIETLKKMWGEGQSASQIAKELGGVTRNAVIGKVHRLGLSNRAAAGAPASGGADAAATPAPAAAPPGAADASATPASAASAAGPGAAGQGKASQGTGGQTTGAGQDNRAPHGTPQSRPTQKADASAKVYPATAAAAAAPETGEAESKPARRADDGVVDLARAKAARTEAQPPLDDDADADTTAESTAPGVGPSAPGSYARRAIVPAGQPLPPQPSANEISPEALATVREVEKTARRLTLMELTERTCKWPIGDPATADFWFCGLPTQAGKPYCEAHVGVAFQPMSTRRDRRR